MNKIKGLFSKKEKKADPRITNSTVAEHREIVLAGGRKFKYPIQYSRHKLVINTILVVVLALIALIMLSWWQLYKEHNSSTFFYRLTTIVPVPVAEIDGKQVRFSDYLMHYRSSEYYIKEYDQINLNTEDGKRQLDYIRRKTMDNVLANAYAAKLAKKMKITVSKEEVDAVIERDKSLQGSKITQETYDASVRSLLNWSPSEYRQDVKQRLILQKVSYAMDEEARQKKERVISLLKSGIKDFNKIIEQIDGKKSGITKGSSGLVSISASFGGLSSEAAKYKKGQVTDVIKSTTGDGYYVLRVLDKTDEKVNYEFINIPLTAFEKDFEKIRSDKSLVKEYIEVPVLDKNSIQNQ